MSKKKVSGNTMTLKDFHGGSIPSDLPLPSAPGITVRNSDRAGYEQRPSSWGNPMAMGRSRPHTSPSTRHFDEKTPFLSHTHTAQIGKHFDEDERKPLDGGSAPRRTISDADNSIWKPNENLKPGLGLGGLGGSSLGRQVAPVSQTHVGTVNSYSVTSAVVAIQVGNGVNSQNSGGSSTIRDQGTGGIGVYPNVWAVRKEVASSIEPEQSALSGPNAASKLAHASALEKVSSGIWQSKMVHYQKDVGVVGSSEVESGSRANDNATDAYNRMDTVSKREYHDAVLARHAERGLGIDNQIQGGRNELRDYEKSGVSKYSDVRPRGIAYHTDGAQLTQNDSKLGGFELQDSMPSEPTERPKLKLLPRIKPLESSEPSVPDYVQGYRKVNDSGDVEIVNETHAQANLVKLVSAGTDSGKEVGHRPKLNLKPRSQPPEQLEGNTERDRNALFGGARPRELVLKERGIDDVAINSFDTAGHSNRIEHNIARAEKVPDRSTQTRYGEKTEDVLDQRTGKKHERKEQRVDAERVNAQRRNWRGDNGRNMRETDRKQVSERQPSPETWRKPVEQSKSSPDAVSMRHGRAASAVELAQAFSRSVSDPKVNDRFSGQRGVNTGRTQMPFSRLVGPTPRP